MVTGIFTIVPQTTPVIADNVFSVCTVRIIQTKEITKTSEWSNGDARVQKSSNNAEKKGKRETNHSKPRVQQILSIINDSKAK